VRDWLAAAALFAATAGVVLWRNAHVAVLFDLSYILNTRNALPSVRCPTATFPWPTRTHVSHQAAIIRITGRIFFHHILYTAITGGLGTVLAWRIALTSLCGRVTAAWTLALALAVSLIFLGVYSIVPTPSTTATAALAAGRDLCVYPT